MTRGINVTFGSGDVFRDLGFSKAEAAEALTKSELIAAIAEAIVHRELTQVEAAKRCRTNSATLAKVMRGRMENITIDQLTVWLAALGR